MTERLNQLMIAETEQLDIPPVAADAALARGRGLRRRRTFAKLGAGAAVLAVVGGLTFVVANGGDNDDRAVEPAGQPGSSVPAFGLDSKVYVGDRTASVPDSIHSLHYTSAGVLVRSNPNDGASDGSGPESLTLVRYDGTTADLGTIPEGVGPATDPDEAIYVLAEARGDGFAAVVRDAETGDTLAEVPLPEGPPSYWPVPPLALDGDILYVGYESETMAVELSTGDDRVVDGMGGGIPEVLGGRTVAQGSDGISVLDAASGEILRTIKTNPDGWGTLSPDGRYLGISGFDDETFESTFTAYDVDTGEVVDLGQLTGTQDVGWTAEGDAFAVAKGVLTTCDLDTADCSKRDVPVPADAFVHLGGRTYES